METKFMEQTKLMNLPILRHFEESQIATIGSENKYFPKKGENGIFGLLRLALIGGIIYLGWTYVLPPVFMALGKLAAVASTIAGIILLVAMAPHYLKWVRMFSRKVAEKMIKADPFGTLAKQKLLMLENQIKFRKSKGKIDGLQQDMVLEASKSEANAKILQGRIVKNHAKGQVIKGEMDVLIQKHGESIKSEDEYINRQITFLKVVSDAERASHEYNQEVSFVTKYGARGSVMKNLSQKLALIEVSMDIKIKDFDATINILKKDFEFTKKSREATTAAKDAMMFTKNWEVELALDVVTSTIAEDIAITTGNIKDIDSITMNSAMDSDEMWANLNTLTEDFRLSKSIVPSSKVYKNPDYQLTSKDRELSGGFNNLDMF